MQRWTLRLLTCLLAFSLALPLVGEEKEGKGKKRDALPGPLAAVNEKLDELGLSDEQKEKVKKVVEQYKEKMAAAAKKSEGNLTEEQHRAAREAIKEAKSNGKKGGEIKSAVENAVQLTDEQKKAKDEGAKEMKTLTSELREALAGVLTPDQLGKLTLDGRKKKKDS